MLCFDFDAELTESLPTLIHDVYTQMTDTDRIQPDVNTFERILSILSFAANGSLCLHYFKLLTQNGLRPTVQIFNSLISGYCNEITHCVHLNVGDVMFYEKQMEVMFSVLFVNF